MRIAFWWLLSRIAYKKRPLHEETTVGKKFSTVKVCAYVFM